MSQGILYPKFNFNFKVEFFTNEEIPVLLENISNQTVSIEGITIPVTSFGLEAAPATLFVTVEDDIANLLLKDLQQLVDLKNFNHESSMFTIHVTLMDNNDQKLSRFILKDCKISQIYVDSLNYEQPNTFFQLKLKRNIIDESEEQHESFKLLHDFFNNGVFGFEKKEPHAKLTLGRKIAITYCSITEEILF